MGKHHNLAGCDEVAETLKSILSTVSLFRPRCRVWQCQNSSNARRRTDQCQGPMHDAEEPVTRTYFLTEDIEAATKQAVAAGAELAHPVTEIPEHGKFSIFFHGSNQFGYWQV